MRRLLHGIGIAVSLVLLLVVVGIAALLALRAYRQHLNEEAIAIRSPAGIEEAQYVTIGGIEQWIQIRGQDRGNPVILCLHGGPGGTWLPLTTVFVPWEKDFTVVQWDQRGAGKTLESTGPSVAATMSIDRMTRDGIEVAEYLRSHLRKDRIILLGHSWGSILGTRMVRERPDLFSAYVGTGQVSDMAKSQQWSYDKLLERARAASDGRALETLAAIGRPPFDSMEKTVRFFGVMDKFGSDAASLSTVGPGMLAAPHFSLRDIYYRYRGFASVPPWPLYRDMLATDLPSQGLDFETPVYFLQGDEDDVTPVPFAQDYFERIRAPHKEMLLIHGAGHFAVWTRADEFLQLLQTRVRPR